MEKKKTVIYSIVALVTLALLVIGATYAYFQNQYGSASNADVKVTTYTTDLLTFETGDAINITADQESFAQGKGNQTGSTFAKATLQANNKTNTATANYYVYLLIESNEFSYSANEEKPELILNVTDDEGNNITIDGLTQKTVTDGKGTSITGYDVTLNSGLLTLFNKKTIEVTTSDNGKKIENWNVTLTLVNYDFNQNNNAGKSFTAKLIIQKDIYPTVVGDVCNNGDNLADCIATLNNKSENFVTNIYHHDGTIKNSDGNILDAEDNSYRYAGQEHDNLYSCTYNGVSVQNFISGLYFPDKESCDIVYQTISSSTSTKYYGKDFNISIFGNEVAIKWDSTNNKCVTINGDEVYFYFSSNKLTKEFCVGNATEFKNKYYALMNVGSGVSKLVDLKESVNNYICFGSDDETCSNDNLYRIIGVIDDKVKLIKADLATSSLLGTDGDYSGVNSSKYNYYRGKLLESEIPIYYFNYNGLEDKTINNGRGSSDWDTSLLNNTNLNTNFLNNIGQKWASKIVESSWKISKSYSANIKTANNSEISETGYQAKVGLLSITDHGYAANPEYWSVDFKNWPAPPMLNWFSLGINELSLLSSEKGFVYPLSQSGRWNYLSDSSFGSPVRPVFYLNSNVQYLSGVGTYDEPIRIIV